MFQLKCSNHADKYLISNGKRRIQNELNRYEAFNYRFPYNSTASTFDKTGYFS